MDSEMTSEVYFTDQEEVSPTIDRSKKIKKLNMRDYVKKCRRDEDFLR